MPDPADDPNLFAGRTRLYYGRWDYKYAQAAKKLHAKIKKWSKAGNPNVKSYESLLDAELMALQGKNVYLSLLLRGINDLPSGFQYQLFFNHSA